MENKSYHIDIPKRFYCDASEKPFEHCQVCGKYLLEEGTTYMIEKAFKNYEGYDFYSTLFEYAICVDCHATLQKGMSTESMQNLQQYYMRIFQEKGGQPVMINLSDFELDNWLSKCFFTDEPITGMKEYQAVGQFNGTKLVLNTPPLIVGETAMEEMSSLLSNQTVDEMNGFKNRFFGPDPELEELILGKKLILI
jgi:hypothetical protein